MRQTPPVPWESLPRGSSSEPQPLEVALDRVARSLGAPSADALATIFGQWAELVGDAVAANSRPKSLTDGELVVAVDDPAWSTQLRLLEPVLLERLADRLGIGAVTALRVQVELGR